MRVYPIAMYSLVTILAILDARDTSFGVTQSDDRQKPIVNNRAIAAKNADAEKSQSSVKSVNNRDNIQFDVSPEITPQNIPEPEFSSSKLFNIGFWDSIDTDTQFKQTETTAKSVSSTISPTNSPGAIASQNDFSGRNSQVKLRDKLKYKDKFITREPEQDISQEVSQTLPNPNEPTEVPDFPPLEDDTPPITEEEVQNELGEIDIIQPKVRQPPRRKQPNGQLLLRSSVFSSSNITSLENFRNGDTLFVNSATFLVTPKLGEKTRLIATAGGGLARFATEGDSNYNFLNFGVGVQQRIGKGMYAQFGWAQDRIYREDDGDRLLLDDSLRLVIGRQDQLDKKLRLDSFYELRGSFASPNEQNRIANSLGARLRYDISPKLQSSVSYRLSLQDFTQQSRFDSRHRLGLQAVYSINRDLFVGGSASYLFGSSSASNIDLDNFSVGFNIGLNVPLF